MNGKSARIVFTALAMSLALIAASAMAGTINLLDQNSAISINTTSGTAAGMTNWTVSSQNIASRQWFWYSIDSGTQAPIDTLTLTGSGTYFNIGGGTRGGYVTYSGSNGFNVEVDYLLTGGSNNGQSDLSESFRLTNSSSAGHTFHFYDYSDFNLSPSSDSVQFPNANTVNQTGGVLPLQSVFAPTPNRWEGATYPQTLNSLNGGSPYQLSNSPGVAGSTIGPANVTWAYEWDPAVSAGATFVINSGQHVDPGTPVPEPCTAALLGAMGLMLMGLHWRRARS